MDIQKLGTERNAQLLTMSGRFPSGKMIGLHEMYKDGWTEEEIQNELRKQSGHRRSDPIGAADYLRNKKEETKEENLLLARKGKSESNLVAKKRENEAAERSRQEEHEKIWKDKTIGRLKSGGLHEAYADQLSDVEVKGNMTFLPRGGILVKTNTPDDIDIQFGIPPETIKDSMILGVSVPKYFVVSHEMFDRVGGTSMAEFEFPAYFNFFVLKRKVTIICREGLSESIKAIFKETLIGPDKEDYMFDKDFPPGTDPKLFPNFWGEGLCLDPARKNLKGEDLLEIREFDAAGQATVGTGDSEVKIRFLANKQEYRVYKFDKKGKREQIATVAEDIRRYKEDKLGNVKRSKLEYQPLTTPEFGVTVLGASHGFDPAGSTTGFVIWVNGKGMVVDPPPGSSDVLKKLSIPDRAIHGIILTHCHADHDAGTFQRILTLKNVKLYTTTTIFNSFIRKYSAVTGLDRQFLCGLFTFMPCLIGVPVPFHGAHFKLFYSIHTIPCIGFECSYGETSMIYSADTNSDPSLPTKMFEEGVIKEGRRDALLNNALKGKHTLIFHEAGVPPIHTPMELLANQPDSVKERLYLVHVSENKVPSDVGLRVATEWSTMVLQQYLDLEMKERMNIKHTLSATELFQHVEDEEYEKFIFNSTEKIMVPRDTVLFDRGEVMEHMYYVLAGSVLAITDSKVSQGHRFHAGHLIGQEFIVDEGNVAGYKAKSETAVILYKIKIEAAKCVVHKREALNLLKNLADLMKSRTWDAFACNLLFREFTIREKVDLFNIFSEEITIEPEGRIDCQQRGCLVVDGIVHVLMDSTVDSLDEMTNEEIREEAYTDTKESSGGGKEGVRKKGEATGVVPGQTGRERSNKRENLSPADRSRKLIELERNVRLSKVDLPGFMSGTIELLAQRSEASINLNSESKKTTFRGNHMRSAYVDEVGETGTMILDINSLILRDPSLMQVEAISNTRVRMLDRKAAINFMKHSPGILVKLLDSFMSTDSKIVC
ncbi:hypothetical protein TrCOL_g2736 [Triparma columacea]|uniref:Cyclic nucleotide-binding domain-containing protein n=1 Tax=Triparma columacea TaxID=722753 RepID=A0A9W7GDV7_9STRA|nr:hypothetical protein TrCOL_g2736 [Triparma columacea]